MFMNLCPLNTFYDVESWKFTKLNLFTIIKRNIFLIFQCAKFLDDQAILQWQQYTRKRIRLIENPNSGSGNVQQQNAEVSIKQEESTETWQAEIEVSPSTQIIDL